MVISKCFTLTVSSAGSDGLDEVASLPASLGRERSHESGSAPTACSRAPGSMDVFAVGAAGALLHATWHAAGFSEFESPGGIDLPGTREAPIAGQVSACSCGDRRVGVFARSSRLPVEEGTTRLDVFVRGLHGDLLHSFWGGQGWKVFESLGMPRSIGTGAPIPFTRGSLACAWEKFRHDVLARGAGGKL